MARSWLVVILAVMSVSPICVPAQSPSVAPAPAIDCVTILIDNLSNCLTYVEAGSNLTAPEKGCCSGLSTVVVNEPQCLCTLLSGGAENYGIQVNQTKAFKLPTVCRVSTPPVSLCAVLGVPVTSPVGSPSGGPTSSVGPSPSGGPNTPAAAAASPPKANGVTTSYRASTPVFLASVWLTTSAIFF